MFTDRVNLLDETLAPFDLLWTIDERTKWDNLDEAHKERLLQAARDAPTTWPDLTATLYLDFVRTGRRDRFEAVYMERRRMLCAFVLAECVLDEGEYLDRIIDGALLICEESGWQLPAHNTYVRDTPCLPLPDPERPVIDLFAAETGALLATLVYLLRIRLDKVSPLMVQRIEQELHKRILAPYQSEHFWWMGKGDEPMCNWTAWCTQNILLTAFLVSQPTEARLAILAKSAQSLDAFLKDYGQDGACEEGILYYRHAALCLFNAMMVMSTVSPSVFGPLWNEPKIKNMAEFVRHMHVQDDRYFNFADSSARAGFCGAREYLFACAVGSDALKAFALESWRCDPRPDLPDEINLFYRLQTVQNMSARPDGDLTTPVPEDHYYPSIGLLTVRDDDYCLAVKAGHNAESHNHNDVGSVTLYKQGKPFLIDVGVETYNAKTFSDRRYDIWTMQSNYHNLPSFNGIGQSEGASSQARDVKVSMQPDHTIMSMNIAHAYPEEAGISRYQRTVRFLKGHGITIIDEWEGACAPVLSLMTSIRPELQRHKVILPNIGSIQLEGAGAPALEPIDITDPRLRQAWPEQIYRILIPIVEPSLTMQID